MYQNLQTICSGDTCEDSKCLGRLLVTNDDQIKTLTENNLLDNIIT